MVVIAIALFPRDGRRRGRGFGRGTAHGPGRGGDGLDDVHVTGAAAEVALEALADLVVGRARVLLQQVRGGHDEAWRAVAALEAVLVPERLLDRVQRAVRGRHALDRLDLVAVGLDSEERARLDRLAIHVHRAGAALAGVAADVRAGQAGHVPEVVDQEESRLDLGLAVPAVDGD